MKRQPVTSNFTEGHGRGADIYSELLTFGVLWLDQDDGETYVIRAALGLIAPPKGRTAEPGFV